MSIEDALGSLSRRKFLKDAGLVAGGASMAGISPIQAGVAQPVRETDRDSRAGTTDSKEYEQAVAEYLKRHLCRLDPWPKDLLQSFDMSSPAVYKIMWGPSEFYPTGNLKTYERVERLHEIKVPTFFTAGRYDEATPEATAWYRLHVPGSTLRIFENSSHMAMFEEPDAYVGSIREFLKHADGR